MAAGMAKQGALPVFAVYSSFMQRGFDMLIHDVALQGLHVVFGIDRAGIVGSDGETHHGIFDLDYLSAVPGMTVLCPSNYAELRDMLEDALFRINGPVALRYPRGGEGEYKLSPRAAEHIVRPGKDLTMVAYGTMINEALSAAELLSASGISAEVIKLGSAAPADFSLTLEIPQKDRAAACGRGGLRRRLCGQADHGRGRFGGNQNKGGKASESGQGNRCPRRPGQAHGGSWH